jgi:hypothetical protein
MFGGHLNLQSRSGDNTAIQKGSVTLRLVVVEAAGSLGLDTLAAQRVVVFPLFE